MNLISTRFGKYTIAKVSEMSKIDDGNGAERAVVIDEGGSIIRHSRSSSAPTTHVIYTKTSCYFCSEWLENDSFKVNRRKLVISVI